MNIGSVLKQFTIILGFSILLICPCLGGLWYWLRWGYYDELHEVEREVQKMSGVKLLAAGGNEDVTLEDIYAKIAIEKKGTIMFLGLTSKSFKGGENIIISQIGDLHPRIKGFGYNGVYSSSGKPIATNYWGFAIELTRNGPFVSQFPFSIKTVQDAVAHFDDIKAIISKWPRCPEYQVIHDGKGGSHCYCIGDEQSNYPEGCEGTGPS